MWRHHTSASGVRACILHDTPEADDAYVTDTRRVLAADNALRDSIAQKTLYLSLTASHLLRLQLRLFGLASWPSAVGMPA